MFIVISSTHVSSLQLHLDTTPNHVTLKHWYPRLSGARFTLDYRFWGEQHAFEFENWLMW